MNAAGARIEVRDLVKTFRAPGPLPGLPGRRVAAVAGVSFSVAPRETLGLVGESGSGKTTLGRTILGLLPPDAGSVRYRRDAEAGPLELFELGAAALRRVRAELQIVFQDPLASLDPRRTVRDAVAEGLVVHRLARGSEVDDRVVLLLGKVGIGDGMRGRYPHELSGGERQRVAIARALAVGPTFLVLDEPVSSLDASVQAQVLNLLLDLQQELGLSYLFIAHDLAVVRRVADRVAVMQAGRIVESGALDEVFGNPAHPHTRALLDAMPVL